MARLDMQVILVGLVVAVLGDALFQDAGIGLNLPLWLGALMLAAWALRPSNPIPDPVLPWLLGLALFFAACLAWRASPFLRLWNAAALLSAAVAIGTQLRTSIAGAWPADYARGAAVVVGHLAGGPVGAVAGALASPGHRDPAVRARLRAAGIGVALAVPVVLVFGGLLTSADPVLDAFVTRLFSWDPGLLLEHALLILLLGWIAVGWLRAFTSRHDAAAGSPLRPPLTFGATEIAIPLGALVVLLAAFIGLQARYLFGGEAIVRTTGFTYAEFARRGFFELVFLSALVVPLLYGAQWVVDRGRRTAVESFRALVVALAALVGLVMVSALARMRLYVAAYGLTEDRLYAAAFMIWVGWVLAWFVSTELRARPSRFASGAVLGGFALLAALNALNPDALIARTNLARAERGRPLDVEYLAQLSVDAVPAVVAAWPGVNGEARCELRAGLIARSQPVEDWREWTWAASVAARARARITAEESCP